MANNLTILPKEFMLKFGTDGWRGTLAKDFTFKNVAIATKAISECLKEAEKKPSLLIGYDTRFLSDKFALCAATIAAHSGIDVYLCESFAPTPIISYAVTFHKTSGAIIVTASHNPYFYNGLKFKNSLGGSASPKQTKIFEEKIKQIKEVDLPEVDIHSQNPEIKTVNPKNEYFSHLEGLVDCELISSSNPKVIVDPMFGAGQGYYYQLLKRLGVNVLEIHNQIDPFFGGLQPEPIMPHLNELKQTVVSEGYDLGLALDGDADRSGIIDNQGNFINSHQIFSLLLWHLTENKGQKGSVIKTVSTTSLIDKITATNTLPLVETPVGFKHISDHMIKNDVLIGGEESGGIGARGHIPERDGIFIGLLVLEMLALTKKTIPELLAKLFQKYGNFVYDRKDLDISDNLRKTFYEQLNQLNAQDFFNKQIDQTKNKDGIKYLFNDGSWLMLRLSGTEAVVRVYSEADSKSKVEELLKKGESLVTSLTSI